MTDVPSPIDFHDMAQARKWVEKTVADRPWRPQFFQAFAAALNAAFDRPASVVEIGSGPGHLAREIVTNCRVSSYAAIDFSAAMHALAKESLGPAAARVTFLRRDFREPAWTAGLRDIDAALTLQAAHEMRHKRHVPALLRQMHDVLSPDGLLLFCDYYAEPGSAKNSDLYLSKEEQPAALAEAGFGRVERLLDLGGMALYRACREGG